MKMNKKILALLGTGHAITDISQGALSMMLAFLQPAFVPAADRWGMKNIIVISMASLIPLLYLFVHLHGFWTTILVALMGFVIISTFSATVVLGQEMMPNNVGLASGLLLGFGIGMGGVGATMLGWVADRWELLAVFETLIIFPVIGLLLALLLPNREEITQKQQQ